MSVASNTAELAHPNHSEFMLKRGVTFKQKKEAAPLKRGPKCTVAIEASDGFSAGVPSSWEVPAANCALFVSSAAARMCGTGSKSRPRCKQRINLGFGSTLEEENAVCP